MSAIADRHLRRLTAWMLWLLLAEFLLGMSVNLFVSLPSAHPGAGAPDYISGLLRGLGWALGRGVLLLRLHVALGLLLVGGGTALLAIALLRRLHPITALTAAGWIGVTGAAFNGGSFINYGKSFSSMLMATGFALAATSYVLAMISLLRMGERP